jgi:uncharacterized protein (TIGR03086 family)
VTQPNVKPEAATSSAIGPDPVAMLAAAAATTGEIIARVRPDQLDLATPCDEWSVRDVINHMIQGSERAVTILASGDGSSPRPPLVDATGDDPAGAFAAAAGPMIAAFQAPGARARPLRLRLGTIPAEAFAGFCAVDFLAHGWDIARATGQPTDYAPELHEAALAVAHGMLDGRSRDPMPFNEEQPVPANASAADRLAAFLGHEV